MLSVVSTPIGNLGDITLRAIETLKQCDVIVCEDTRVTGQLLKHLGLPKKALISFHSFNQEQRLSSIVRRLSAGEHLALLSDAGTPGISDPGFLLISRAREAGISIEAIPGPAAFLAALSISGLPIHHFVYLGFLPLKKGRRAVLQSIADAGARGERSRTIVFYESVHRIERTLRELAAALRHQPERPLVIARELTKLHEEVIRTTVAELPEVALRITKKGEFVIMIGAM